MVGVPMGSWLTLFVCIGVGNSAAGQDKSKDKDGNQLTEKETDEDHEIEITINDILKRSPGIYLPSLSLACAVRR
jgi:hypothetical protein